MKMKIDKKELEQFCADVLTIIAGTGWFNVEEEKKRIYDFIEKHVPEVLFQK